MSTQAEVDYGDAELSEQAIHDYLAAHPDFFENMLPRLWRRSTRSAWLGSDRLKPIFTLRAPVTT